MKIIILVVRGNKTLVGGDKNLVWRVYLGGGVDGIFPGRELFNFFIPLPIGENPVNQHSPVSHSTKSCLKPHFLSTKIRFNFSKTICEFPNQNNYKSDHKCQPPWLGDKEKFSL